MPKSCPVCGSRKWRKDGVTGNAVCEDGHVFQDFRSENLVLENVGHTLQKRAVRRGERLNKRKVEGRTNADLYHGEEAEWLKLQALQLMLRLQVKEIRRIWGLPEVLEMIVRELWAYQLAISPLASPPGSSSLANASKPGREDEEAKGEAEHEKTDDKGEEEGDESDSSSDAQTEKGDGELEEDILAELSDRSEGSDDELQAREKEADGARGPPWKRRRRLRASDTLATLVMGCWILRIPVVNVDIQSLVNDNRLPYLDFAHTTHVPTEMFRRMNRDTRVSLSPRRSPTPLFIFDETKQLARTLHRHFELNIPEINLPPISWRLIYSLGGTPTVYQQVHRLLALIDVNLSLLDSDLATYARKARRGRTASEALSIVTSQYTRTRRNRDVVLPELSVVSAWVIVLKMAYGLDGRPRSAASSSDPLVSYAEPEAFIKALNGRLAAGDFSGSRQHLEEQQFASKGPDDLDRYLDQCQAVLLGSHPTTTDAGPFPLPPVSNAKTPPSSLWAEFHQSTDRIEHVPHVRDALEPGEKIRSWDAQDVTGELPRSYETVLRAGATLVGVNPTDVATTVEMYERKLEKVRRERSRSRSRSISRPNSATGRRRK